MDIKSIRKKALLTQKEMAEVLNVSLATIQRWEIGQVPSFKCQRKIIEFCKKNNIEI